MLDNGSSSPYESISLSVEGADISCLDGESPTVTLVVTGDDTQLQLYLSIDDQHHQDHLCSAAYAVPR
jgi:hypothetical protein